MLKRILPAVGIAALVLLAWIAFQYQQSASEALERIKQDKLWLRTLLPEQQQNAVGPFEHIEHQNKNWVQTELVQQGVSEGNLFVRVYNSLFILNGQRSCLRTSVIYPNRQATIEDQR